MVIHGYCQHPFGLLLTNDVLVENFVNFFGDREFRIVAFAGGFLYLFADNVVTQIDAFITNEN